MQLNDVQCSTMESRITPGLFLCGEVLDVFGRIGGLISTGHGSQGELLARVLLNPETRLGLDICIHLTLQE